MNLNLAFIGCDTSHALEYSRILNDEDDASHVSGARIIAAVVGGEGAMPGSRDRALRHAAEIESRYGVRLCEEIGDLPPVCDGLIIGTADSGRHLEQVEEVAGLGLPVFVGKPLAPTAAEAERIFEIGREHNVPVMSCSPLRYDPHFRAALRAARVQPVCGADIFGHIELTEGGYGYLWYGVHLAEMLFAAMGTGVKEVAVLHRESHDAITAVWEDGRIGTLRGTRKPHYVYGGTLHNAETPVSFAVPEHGLPFYAKLLQQVVEFVRTGVSPIAPAETIEIIRFLETAEQLRAQGHDGACAIPQEQSQAVHY